MAVGLVFNIQKYSLHDGPGIRTTVFLKGCPLDCAWCHNPEGISRRREIMVVETRCLGCGECRRVCPEAAMLPGEGAMPARLEKCKQCGVCVAACPTGGRRFVGEEFTANQLLETLEQDRVFYETSGGGVTFSGGEPLCQFEFLREMLLACQERRLPAIVDTCGYGPKEHLLALAPLTSIFLYDLKLLDEAKHRRYTGVSNHLILSNLKALGARHRRIWLRMPVIPGVNDSQAELEAAARFAAGLSGVEQVNLLPYHRTGRPKARRAGRPDRLAKAEAPSAEQMSRAAAIFSGSGLNVLVGG